MNHVNSSRMTGVAIAATVVVLAFAAQSVRGAEDWEPEAPSFSGLTGMHEYISRRHHRTWSELYRSGDPDPNVGHGSFTAEYLDERQMAEYEEWQKNVDANNTRILVKVNSQSFDLNDELRKLRQVYGVSTFDDFQKYGPKDFELKVRGAKAQYMNLTMAEIREWAATSSANPTNANYFTRRIDDFFNSWRDIYSEWELWKNMVENTVARLERLDIELNIMMRNVYTQVIRDELDRESVASTMGTPEHISSKTKQAIMFNSRSKNSVEINGAAFVTTVTFLLVLFNAYRFAMLFYKSRNNEKLVATDMTFAHAE